MSQSFCSFSLLQACYGILKVPQGNWLCRTCALGVQPKCLLCPKRGGALKPTRSGTKWVHVSCALWIPEVRPKDRQIKSGVDNWTQHPQISDTTLFSMNSWCFTVPVCGLPIKQRPAGSSVASKCYYLVGASGYLCLHQWHNTLRNMATPDPAPAFSSTCGSWILVQSDSREPSVP